MKGKTSSILRAYPNSNLIQDEVLFHNNILLVTQATLARYFSVSAQSIRQWKKEKGLQQVEEFSTHHTPMFDLKYVIKWHKENINQKMSNIRTGHNDVENNFNDDDITKMEGFELLSELDQKAFLQSTKDPLDRIKVMGDIRLSRLKLDKENGNLIDKEEVEITISEYVGIFISQLKMDLKILPPELQNKTAKEISDFLNKHFHSTTELLKEVFVESTHIDDVRVYEVFDLLGELLRKHSVNDIGTILENALKNGEET